MRLLKILTLVRMPVVTPGCQISLSQQQPHAQWHTGRESRSRQASEAAVRNRRQSTFSLRIRARNV